MADLLFYWFGFNQTSESVVNLNVGKALESKPVKVEVSQTVMHSLMNYEVKESSMIRDSKSCTLHLKNGAID